MEDVIIDQRERLQYMRLLKKLEHRNRTKKSVRYWQDSEERLKRCRQCLEDEDCIKRYILQDHKINILRKKSAYDFFMENGNIRKIFSDETSRETIVPYSSEETMENRIIQTEKIPCNRLYISEIQDAYVIGDIDIIISSGNCISDLFSYNADVSGVVTQGERCAIEFDYSRVKNISKAIDLKKMYSNNYFHITFECLSRFQYIDEFKEYNDFPILMDESAYNFPQYEQLLEYLGVNKHKIIRLAAGEVYHVDSLIYPSMRTWRGVSPLQMGCDPLLGVYLKKCFEISSRSEMFKGEKIYIYRGNRLENEKEVVSELTNQGYKIVKMEDLSIPEQIACFRNADVLIGTHGAAFTNLIYVGDNTLLFQISDMKYAIFYDSLAYNLDIKLYTICAESLSDMHFRVSISKIKELPDRIAWIRKNEREIIENE